MIFIIYKINSEKKNHITLHRFPDRLDGQLVHLNVRRCSQNVQDPVGNIVRLQHGQTRNIFSAVGDRTAHVYHFSLHQSGADALERNINLTNLIQSFQLGMQFFALP